MKVSACFLLSVLVIILCCPKASADPALIDYNNASEEKLIQAVTKVSEILGAEDDAIVVNDEEDDSSDNLTIGHRKTALILAYYENQKIPQHYWKLSALAAAKQSSAWFVEASYNKLSIDFDLYAWVKIPMDAPCAYPYVSRIIEEADSQIDYTQYHGVTIFIPSPLQPECIFGGFGSIGTSWFLTEEGGVELSYSVINALSLFVTRVASRGIIHEMGHNLGLGHANFVSCPDGEVLLDSYQDCQVLEYGDLFDMMGQAGGFPPKSYSRPHFNGYFKQRLGWLDSSSVTEVNSSENVPLIALEKKDSGWASLIAVPQIDPLSQERLGTFYVESRKPLGEDFGMLNPLRTYQGVLIHYVPTYNSMFIGPTLLLNAVPEEQSAESAAFLPGQDFVDPISEVRISVLGQIRGVFEISVEYPTE